MTNGTVVVDAALLPESLKGEAPTCLLGLKGTMEPSRILLLISTLFSGSFLLIIVATEYTHVILIVPCLFQIKGAPGFEPELRQRGRLQPPHQPPLRLQQGGAQVLRGVQRLGL